MFCLCYPDEPTLQLTKCLRRSEDDILIEGNFSLPSQNPETEEQDRGSNLNNQSSIPPHPVTGSGGRIQMKSFPQSYVNNVKCKHRI